MTLSKATRRIVVGLTAVVMLLCQSSALAHACAGSAADSAARLAHPPCHHEAGGNDAQGPAHDSHPAQCLSQAASTSTALPDIPPLAGLPALGLPVAALRIGECGLSVSEPPPVRGKPPPLIILYCRLLV